MTALRVRGHARHRAEADSRGARLDPPNSQASLPRDEPSSSWSKATGSKATGSSGRRVSRVEARATIARAVPRPNCRRRRAGVRAPRGGRELRPDARRRQHQQQHSRRDEAGRHQRRRRVQPHRRCGEPDCHPHPVRAQRDKQPRQWKLRAAAPARLLPQPADHRLALPPGQPGHEVDRDPLRAAFRRPVQPGPMVRSRRDVLVPNPDHGAVRSRRSTRARTPRINTGSPRRRTASPEYNATDCRVHREWKDFLRSLRGPTRPA
jgi:hypothetical protein